MKWKKTAGFQSNSLYVEKEEKGCDRQYVRLGGGSEESINFFSEKILLVKEVWLVGRER